MLLRKIILNGYKRFKSLTIDFGESPKRIVALVRQNGCVNRGFFYGMLHSEAYQQFRNKVQKILIIT